MQNEKVIQDLKQARDLIDDSLRALSDQGESDDFPTETKDPWEELLRLTAHTAAIPNEIKPAFISQAIQETGRGQSLLFQKHCNPAGMKWREEMKGFATPVNVEVTSEPSGHAVFCHFLSVEAGIQGYAHWLTRSPYAGWREYEKDPQAFLRFIGLTWAADPDYTRACIGHLQEAMNLLSDYGWTSAEPIAQRLHGKSFLVDAGHSRSAQGATSRDKGVTEYQMTSMMAGIISEKLRSQGATVDLFDPNPDNLRSVGRRAHGKTAAVFVHLNAANRDGNDEGTEVWVHPQASIACRELASRMASDICSTLGTRNRGVKTAGFTVLVEARAVGQEFAVLPESFFLDDWTDAAKITDRSQRAAHAIADTLIDFFG